MQIVFKKVLMLLQKINQVYLSHFNIAVINIGNIIGLVKAVFIDLFWN